jgi:hypothetical protein
MIQSVPRIGRDTLSAEEMAAAMRDGLEARRVYWAPQAPNDLPAVPQRDPMAVVWPLSGLLGLPTPRRPGLKGTVVWLLRGFAKKLLAPWLDHQTRFNHALTAALQAHLAEVSNHVTLLNWRMNEVTRALYPAVHALEGRVNECLYEAYRADRGGSPGEPDLVWAAEETYLQTQMPDPPGQALVLTDGGHVPPSLAQLGYTVLTAPAAAAAELPLRDGAVRLVVAFDRDDTISGATLLGEATGPAIKALSRMLTRSGRVIGSVRTDRQISRDELAARVAPLRLSDVSRRPGVVLWTAAA